MDDQLSWLVGDFILVQVATQPAGEPTISGRLHLARPDTTIPLPPFRRWPDLLGWFETPDTALGWRASANSHDPLNPGVTVNSFGMRIGEHYMNDAAGDDFRITAMTRDAFWGWWKSDLGIAIALDTIARRVIPDPAGYFCATRVK